MTDLQKGSVWVLSAFFFMAVFGIFTKAAYLNDGALWVSFLTYASGAFLMALTILYKGVSYFKTEHFSYHFGRAAFGVSASFLYTVSMYYVPIVDATLLFNTTPIFIPILAAVWLKQSINKSIWLAVLLGFIGIIIIIKPESDMWMQPGNLIGLASGFCLAVAYLLIKRLRATDSSLSIVAYFFILSTLLQAPFLSVAGSFPIWQSCFLAILGGCALTLAQLCLVKGYEYADPSQLGVYQYTTVVFVGLFDWLYWGVVPTLWDMLGAILVVIAAMVIIRSGKEYAK